ncbi:polar chromosome segregation protein [Streptococcus pneumoniae]|uniref:MerR family transcriptional regulator n=2 Tax=Bacillota TaxID=1239 RepID=UPI0005E7623B|nr:MerR family transcriptional regulator [Bacillus paranthracis]CKE55020.1 polar chromosome segregation protein [Streptococcus pneumoniae]CKE89611.1 polar chromosome segregation protein [Streptococcus pneumoniae]CKF03164.1 polar chromosome segregation protein [Bacillus paranthracis]CKF10720.1 polar chromosome segregation protein [Streptococcus pneumoniae]CKF13839.1 polar chromosome segregation protein [Streptococcus pneumoniae]
MEDYGYFAQSVAKELDINTNTLRRWSLELEKLDYEFERNERNQRIYYKKDVNVLKQMKEYLNQNWRLEEAATKSTVSTEDNEEIEKYIEIKNAEKTASVHEGSTAPVTIQERSEGLEIFQGKFYEMIEQQNQIVSQNQQILDMLMEERKEKQEAQQQVQLLQDKLDKAIQLIQEDQEENKKKKKKFLGLF